MHAHKIITLPHIFTLNACIYHKIVVPLRKFSLSMKHINIKEALAKFRNYLPNKYILTIVIFAVILIFVGNHSLISRLKMAHSERVKKEQLREYQDKIAETEAQIRSLDQPGALEKYAREEYLMHADNEDVYLINEED